MKYGGFSFSGNLIVAPAVPHNACFLAKLGLSLRILTKWPCSPPPYYVDIKLADVTHTLGTTSHSTVQTAAMGPKHQDASDVPVI
jgi:hypothetical protein